VYKRQAFPLRAPKLRGSLSPEEERQKVEGMADFLGIMKLLERKPVELSGGEKQRVSLARAMVKEPQVYLLDEPIAHLDARLKFSTQTLLKELAGKLGVTIVYVTHDYREALALSDRILVLRRGGIEQIGTPEEVYHVPSSDFVGRFVGEPPINLIDGEVVSEGKKTFFRAGDDFSIQIREDLLGSMEGVASQEDGKRMVRLGIRCSNIDVAEEKIGDNSFQLPVYAVAREAESSLVTFELRAVFLQVKVEKKVNYGLSDKVWLDFDQDRILFFKKTVELAKG